MRFQLLPMTIDDFDEALTLWQVSSGVGLNEADTRQGIAQYLERNPGLSLVARHSNQMVGAVLCGHDGRRGYLHHLAVARSQQRQGIGRALVEACLVSLGRVGILRCNIFVREGNEQGRAFWRKLGWTTRDGLLTMQSGLLSAE